MHKALVSNPDFAPGESFWFVSLDGELWLGVDREPTPDDQADVEAIFDDSGKSTIPLRCTRGYLASHGAAFVN